MAATVQRETIKNVDQPEIRALLFDVDGVLADTAKLHREAWARLAKEEGLFFDDECAESLRGLSREDSLRRILNGREIPDERFFRLLQRKNDYYVEQLQTLGPGDVFHGSRELLKDAKARGISTASVSASRNARTVIRAIGLHKEFDAIVDGNTNCQHRNRYGFAARLLEMPYEKCVVFEDSRAGIELAHSLGMLVIGIGVSDQTAAADLALHDLHNCTIMEIANRLRVSIGGRPLN